jgi:hypothetical protein
MQTYKITDYDPSTDNHTLEDQNGFRKQVDLFVSHRGLAAHPDNITDHVAFAQSLIGKRVQVETLVPYVEIGHGISLLENQEEAA